MSFKNRILSSLGLLFLTAELLMASPVLARTSQLKAIVPGDRTTTFTTLLEQAQILAAQAIAQEFATNPAISEVWISVLGERQGQVTPLLAVRVTRSQWQTSPNLNQWIEYFTDARVLLRFETPQTASVSPQPPQPVIPVAPPPLVLPSEDGATYSGPSVPGIDLAELLD